MAYRLAICAGFMLLLTACGGSCYRSPTAPSASPVDGIYVGTITDSVYWTGNTRPTLTVPGSSVSGTWTTTFPNATANSSGTTAGTMNGSALTLTMMPSNPGCQFVWNATRNGSQLTRGGLGVYFGV